jgi:hypothetical protein
MLLVKVFEGEENRDKRVRGKGCERWITEMVRGS